MNTKPRILVVIKNGELQRIVSDVAIESIIMDYDINDDEGCEDFLFDSPDGQYFGIHYETKPNSQLTNTVFNQYFKQYRTRLEEE